MSLKNKRMASKLTKYPRGVKFRIFDSMNALCFIRLIFSLSIQLIHGSLLFMKIWNARVHSLFTGASTQSHQHTNTQSLNFVYASRLTIYRKISRLSLLAVFTPFVLILLKFIQKCKYTEKRWITSMVGKLSAPASENISPILPTTQKHHLLKIVHTIWHLWST